MNELDDPKKTCQPVKWRKRSLVEEEQSRKMFKSLKIMGKEQTEIILFCGKKRSYLSRKGGNADSQGTQQGR